MLEIEIKSWTILEAFASSKVVGPDLGVPNYFFRGQALASWDLSPSLLRIVKNKPIDLVLEIEAELIRRFQQVAHLELPSRVWGDDLEEWSMLMQHYGVPTRVLAWTESLYVALYFAVRERPDDDGAVWLVYPGLALKLYNDRTGAAYDLPALKVQRDNTLRDPNADREMTFFTRGTFTGRMMAQLGWSSICWNALGVHNEVLDEMIGDSDHDIAFAKLVVPASLKVECLRRLRTMNIGGHSLYPGLDGLGASLREATLMHVDSFSKTNARVLPEPEPGLP